MNTWFKIVGYGLSAAFIGTVLQAKPQRPKPDLKYIDNGVMKIGIDRSMGASVTWLSWKGHTENSINIHDPGRLLQQSYYAGNKLERLNDGQSKHWSPWVWNPIQGGGVNSWARVSKFEKRGEQALYAETIPKLWDMANEEAEAVMLQLCKFEKGMSNVITVRNWLVCNRKNGDRWGDKALPRHQELPACYFTRQFDDFQVYNGAGKWKTVTQKQGPPWGRVTSKLNAMACFNSDGQGIGIFSPTADQHWNFGPVGKANDKSKPTDSSCVHIAPIGTVPLGPKSVLEYRYWLVVGNKAEIAQRFDQLMKTYKGEKLKLTTHQK
jgi:hypothetical protein